jgi:hypothetical protein
MRELYWVFSLSDNVFNPLNLHVLIFKNTNWPIGQLQVRGQTPVIIEFTNFFVLLLLLAKRSVNIGVKFE